ncbi:MAG TPA: RHS repeat-associated core domain-containing protein [Longimicrobium sp.]|nr:RHS repeat-associated core domain-containing protein [Longimicrobium sp.]
MLKTSSLRAAGLLALVLAAAVPLAVTARTRTLLNPAAHASLREPPRPGVRPATSADPVSGPARQSATVAVTGYVRVEPNGGVAYQARPQVFTIWNTGTTTATFTLAATCQGAATSCAVSPGSVTIGPSASAQATVTFGIGGTGVVQLTATSSVGTASGYINVQPLTSGFRAYHVRSHCVTVALPGSAASECGDLRLAHPLPSVRTMNRVWAPTLLYNSGLAQPRMRFVFTYTPDPAKAAPDSLSANVRLANGRLIGARKWSGWPTGSWAPGQVRRLVYSEDAADLPTATYVVTIEVTVWRSNVPEFISAPGITVPFINRSASPFGAGWWVAGLEQLVHLADGKKFWVDGQGNMALYGGMNDSTYVAWNGERPDTLKKRVNSQGLTRWVRLLPGGARVVFSATGTMDSTVNRLGQATVFTYSGSTLSTITVPGGAVYTFEYGATARPRLWRVRLNHGGAQRAVELDQDADPRIRNLRDPDGALTTLAYAAGDTTQKRVVQRMDPRRLTWATYTYDWTGKITRGQLDMGAAGEADDIIVRINPGESRGAAPTAVPYDSAYTLVDGPRPDSDARDVTRFWIVPSMDTSIPQRVVDALGNETVITYGDARFQYLPTRVDGPVLAGGGRQTSFASYDARGNLSAQVAVNPLGDGRDATTRYERTNAAWPDFVTRVTAPLGEVSETGYDAAGNVQWQQDGRGLSTRVTYGYNAQGLLTSVTEPAARTTAAPSTHTLAYDAGGNLRATRSALGIYTLMYSDALGHDTLVITPVSAGDSASVRNGGVRRRMVYDPAGRVTETFTIAPAHNNQPASTLSVYTVYYGGGLVRSVSRGSTPDIHNIQLVTNEFRYDAAGRKTVEISPPYGFADTTFYDPAGNVVEAHTRRGGLIKVTYDALGRPVRRTTGEDTARFTYDARGLVLSATNRHARVTRTYFPGGLLKTDTSRVQTSTPTQVDSLWTGYTAHVYGLAHQYDLNGRRTRLTYPSNLLANSGITGLRGYAEYGYDPVTGALAWVEGLGPGARFDYRYDTRGRPDSTYMPAGVREAYGYDHDGRMTSRYTHAPAGGSWFAGGALRNDSYSYDARNKMGASATVIGPGGIQHGAGQGNGYDGMGNLISAVHVYDSPFTSEGWRVDAMGNRTDVVRYGPNAPGNVTYVSTYQAGSGALQRTVSVGDTTVVADTTTYYYNLAGDNTGVVEHGKLVANPRAGWNWLEPTYHQRIVERTSNFDSEGRLYEFRQLTSQENGAGLRIRELYAHDAFGRRVWRRAWRGWDPGTQTQRDTMCLRPTAPSDCQSFVERTVWDGDQVIFEIRANSEPGASAVTTEQDAAFMSSPHYGRVAYVHAGGIDQPVELVRMDVQDPFSAVPHANWRGTYDVLTMTSAARYAQCGPQIGYQLGSQLECFPFHLESISAFGEATPRYNDNTDPGPRSWAGSLIEGSRDASGMLYRRNRYVDPASGRFTQEDPIGLAGGVNLYGFAAGDPISYSDPFGLCPPELIDPKTKKCPGGLNEPEYRTVQAAIGTLRPGAERTRLQGMLEGGRIRKVNRTTYGRPAEAEFTRGGIDLMHGFFTGEQPGFEEGYATPGERGWVLGHELGHLVQLENGKLISQLGDPSVKRNPMRILRMFWEQRRGEHPVLQGDANLLGCRLATDPGVWSRSCP